MKETTTAKKNFFTVKAKLLLMSAVPITVVVIAILIIAISFMKSAMEAEILKGLLSSAYTYREIGLVNMDREKGDNEIENQLKNNTGYDFTWFEGDTRKNSSLGASVIGSKATSTVITQVINNKQQFTSTKTEVAGEDYFVAYVPVINSNGEVIGMAFTGVSRESVETQITKSIITMSLSGGFILLIAIIITLTIASSMSGAIKAIEESVTKISEGKFEKVDKYLNRSDELGNALHSTNNLVDKISEVIKDIWELAKLIDLQSSELAETSTEISKISDEVSESVLQVAKGATEQAETTQNASDNIVNLSDAIQNVADNSANLANTANEMNETGKSSSLAIKQLSNIMTLMESEVKDITASMSDTNQAVQKVNKKTEAITKIAAQTNLLALNASIEAARAGDAGNGFSVVADEIGKLAKESGNTANEIQEEMSTLLSQFNDAILKTDDISITCKKVIKVLIDTEIKINDFINNVDLTVEGVTTISALTEECEASKGVIIDAMSSLSAISEENAAATEETSAAMQEVNSAVNVLSEAAKALREEAEKLTLDVSFFEI